MRETFIWKPRNRPIEMERGILPENTFSHEFIEEVASKCFGSTISLGRSCVDGKECHIRIRDDKNSKP
jgi:hypothetical protein